MPEVRILPGSVEPGRVVNFRVVKEGWSRYTLFDGEIVVRTRNMAVRLFEVDPAHPPKEMPPPPDGRIPEGMFLVGGHKVQEVEAIPKWRGRPQPQHPDSVLGLSHGENVDFRVVEEPLNVYLLDAEKGAKPRVLQTKEVAVQILFHRGMFDPVGEPIVQVFSNTVTSPARPARVDELGV